MPMRLRLSYYTKALTSRRPPIRITHAAVKTWFSKYKTNPNQQSIQSATELHEKHAEIVTPLSKEYNTAYKLGAALRKLEPPIFASDGILKSWLMKYGSKMTYIDNAGHLEDLYGQRIRQEWQCTEPRGDLLCSWLQQELQVTRYGRGPYACLEHTQTHRHTPIFNETNTAITNRNIWNKVRKPVAVTESSMKQVNRHPRLSIYTVHTYSRLI